MPRYSGGQTYRPNLYILDGGVIAPATSDGAAIGSTLLMWSDVYVAAGAVINFNNGDVTLTHSANMLTVAGGDITSPNVYIGALGKLDFGAGDVTITNASNAILIEGGDVGIGATPVTTLSIIKNSTSALDTTYPVLLLSNPSAATNSFAAIKFSAANAAVLGFFVADGLGGGKLGEASTYFGNETNHPFGIMTNDTIQLTVRANGNVALTVPKVTAGSGTGVTVNETGALIRLTYKVTVTYAALAAAATTADKVIATLPAKTKLVAIYADTTTTYTGGAVTATTLTVGKTTGGIEYLVSHDVFTATITRGLADADLGTSINRANAIQGGDLPSWTATTDISVRLTTTTANTNALTQGSTTYYLVTEKLP